MVKTGLDLFSTKILPYIINRDVAVLCHAPSIDSKYRHISEIIASANRTRLTTLFGPQHGIHGQTQDNMIEWEGYLHPDLGIPVYSLYGETRKPTDGMLNGTDILIIDLQDVGARPYTYVWTMKNCMEACADYGIEVIIIDRPNPLGGIKTDGAILRKDYYTFVGGAEIPLCHGMTIGELALWINERENINCKLRIIEMEGWDRKMLFEDTGLPWVLPSPNMPTTNTARVYPGMVLIEALNISEGRGTTIPFELFGAPFIDINRLSAELVAMKIPGCTFRQHGFIPTFHKFADHFCNGLQVHITDFDLFEPVYTAACIFRKVIDTCGKLEFINPPYEYEEELIPFDILSGDSGLRTILQNNGSLNQERERWREESEIFRKDFMSYMLY